MSAKPKKKSAKKTPAKKMVTKKAPAKKVEAKKVEAKKVEAKKVEAKKVEAKKATAKISHTTTPSAVLGPDIEPTAGSKAIPALWFAILAALLFWGDMYIMNNGGDLMGEGGSFPPEVYYPYGSYKAVVAANPPDESGGLFADGKKAYNKYCVACHQANGNGMAPQFPPLAGSEWVLADGPNRMIRIVLDGLAGPVTVKGQSYNGVMLPWRDTITDDYEIAAVLTYIRQEWGNNASDVDVAKVTEIREATKSQAGRNWTAPELEAIPVAD